MTNKHRKRLNGKKMETLNQKNPLDVSPKRRSGDAKRVGKGEVTLTCVYNCPRLG